ncbi:MAG: trypsin-like peptidase domain-containing protein [Alphaproteobacteria bacterium]|nr:trypsin-like peptidase domain-containing protein [Alphaproteobacteria bacterium]MCY4317768.1 trypsin-like peptidase domain-containing protein [Alphaproteobacteria bacterium]
MRILPIATLACALVASPSAPLQALPAGTLESVVSVLPVWLGRPQGGAGGRPGAAPEGSGVVLRPGLVVTAWHVVKPARRIDIRLSDGRLLPAQLAAKDAASDIALLRVDASLPPIEIAPAPQLAEPVCLIGNAFGLGLSVTCGVVSALSATDTGFNVVEDFVQTDAAANPGVSGGALVDRKGRLVGMMSAIFASGGDTDIGVNFAVSTELLTRVVEALIADGRVEYPAPGWQLAVPGRDQLVRQAAPVVRAVSEEGPAERAGIRPGDAILAIGPRRVRTPRDAVAALAIIRDPGVPVEVVLLRDGQEQTVALSFDAVPVQVLETPQTPGTSEALADCPHPAPVCRIRQAVFPVSGFDPAASATRIGPALLVTNRHVVADRSEAVLHTPDGPKEARVIPSAYSGDLALLEARGLPAAGFVPDLEGAVVEDGSFYAIGVDITRKAVRVFEPGGLIAKPAEGAALGRLHIRARMQPGVSGGALVDETGQLAGIAVGGGDERFEAVPVAQVRALLALRAAPKAVEVTRRLGAAFAACAAAMDATRDGEVGPAGHGQLKAICAAARNHGQLLEAGRLLARAGDFDGAIALHGQAARQAPHSINARLSLLVSLQLAGRFEEMTGYARQLMDMAPEDPQALRFAVQSGVWGKIPALAEDAYRALKKADPRQAEAARRFIDAAPPPPQRR